MKNLKKISLLIIGAIFFVGCSTDTVNDEKTTSVENKAVVEVDKDFDYFMERIGDDEKWMEKVKATAAELGITEEESLIKSATYMAKQNGFMLVDENQKELDKQILVIRKNEKWVTKLEGQAAEQGISLDSMVVRAAKFTVDQRKLK